ncbi:hypothetical protein LG634_06960 [Streptomyces bambusae]|uniref:hypothetical protein n=1 Tax=Streptomyces bambusae TaxID=1550616 RepID=UPI001CFD18E8|nr:hypothetical protein [Streptomyces bambusae]MCB5164573.1 hypothetical protein [Streptomyces bambusae]
MNPTRIDLAVGQSQAAGLVKRYRDRLVAQDRLPPDRALRLACRTYAEGYVHVVAAPGQVWQRTAPDGTGRDLLLVLAFDLSREGRTVLCEYVDGEYDELLLEDLRDHYALHSWPAGIDGEPAWEVPGGADG